MSITYGSGHCKHDANGVDLSSSSKKVCPCNIGSIVEVPPYVGSDYYCETGGTCCILGHFYPNDTLWDGQQCVAKEAPCCTHPNMPWFNKTLNETTTEDIEVRVCGDGPPYTDEDTPLQMIELFDSILTA